MRRLRCLFAGHRWMWLRSECRWGCESCPVRRTKIPLGSYPGMS